VTPALDRVIKLLENVPAVPDTADGYLDLLGKVIEPHDTVAQRFMRSGLLPKIYEDLWRPVLFGLGKGGPFGPSTTDEYELARVSLGLDGQGAQTVLDVACGPGNVTRALAEGVGSGGLVVGVDASATMLGRAVAETTTDTSTGDPDVGYVRGDAVDLPFRAGSFDAVCCYGALYLFDDPWAAVDAMTRVLVPGGRIVILTTRRLGTPLIGLGSDLLSRLSGVRMFGSGEVSEALSARGFVEVRQRSYGVMQLVDGRLS
jgi:ubiquinone/menaquinone biosynthesis C-methylase UbiE